MGLEKHREEPWIQIPASSQVSASGGSQTGRWCRSNGPPMWVDRHPLCSAFPPWHCILETGPMSLHHPPTPPRPIFSATCFCCRCHKPPRHVRSCWQIARRWKLIPPHPGFPCQSSRAAANCWVHIKTGHSCWVWALCYEQSWGVRSALIARVSIHYW